tara:strand:- start:844 stop:1314 length:471 start_codon:yes stop_codon:yes gene_type:complete
MKTFKINKTGMLEIENILTSKCKSSYFDRTDGDCILGWAVELEDEMNNVYLSHGVSDQIEISPHETKSGEVEWLSVSEKGIDVTNIEWQVTHENESFPSFGLNMFDNESEAFEFATDLISKGEKNVCVHRFENTASVAQLCLKCAEPIMNNNCLFC